MKEHERKAVADAAYDAWRNGENYDNAWDRAEYAVSQYGAYSYYEAEDVIHQYEQSYQRKMAQKREEQAEYDNH